MLLPLRDDNPLNNIRLAYVTLGIIVACVLVFAFQLTLSGEEEQIFVFGFGAIPAVIFGMIELPAAIQQVPAALTLVTSMFLHGGFMHLLGNMLFLWVLGDNVEDAMGHKRFVIFFLAAGVIAALAHAITGPGSQIPMIGASGAISGVIGAYLMLHPKARIKTLVWIFILSLPAWVVLGFWIGLQVLSAATDTGGGVAWWAHIGGFLAGVILVIPMRRKGVPLFDRGKKSFELKLGLSKTKRRKSRIPDSGAPGDGRKKSGPWN